MDRQIIDWLETNDDGEYDTMVEDTMYYILNTIGENGDTDKIADKIRYYAIELCRDALYPLPIAKHIAEQATQRYKDGLYSVRWKETV